MAVLTNKSIASTYISLLSIGSTSTSSLSGSIQSLTDGTGQLSPLAMSTTQIQFNTSTNTFKFPSTRGTINQILKLADANGTLSWADDNLSNTLNFSGGGSTTGSITLNTQILAFTGTANEIVTSASSQAITLSFPTTGVTLPNGSEATTQSIATASVNGAVNNSTTVILDGNVGTIEVGDAVVGFDIVGEITVATVTDQNNITLSLAQTIANNVVLSFRNNTTKVATTAYVEAAITAITPPSGDVSKTGTITANQIAVWNDSTDELRSDAAISIATDGTITLYQPNSDDPIVVTNSYNIGGGNIANVTGVNNVGFGKDNLSTITSGYENIAIGNEAGKGITTGNFNVSIGEYTAIRANSGQEKTTTVGWGANRWNTGDHNTAIGASALTGVYYGTNTGYSNTAIGSGSLTNLTTGSDNTSLGTDSLTNLTTGQKNVALGSRSGFAMTTGSQNVIIGSFTGFRAAVVGGLPEYSIITSSNNIVLSDGDGNVRQVIDSNGKVFIESQYAGGRLNVKSSGTNPYEGINVGSSALDSIYAYITHNGTQALIGSSGIENDAAAYTPLSLQTSEVDRLTISTGGLVKVGNSTQNNSWITTQSTANWHSGIKLTRGLGDNSNSQNNNFGIMTYDNGLEISTFTSPSNDITGRNTLLTISSGGNVGIGGTPPSITGYTALSINNATNGAILDLEQGDAMKARFIATATTATIETGSGIPFAIDVNGNGSSNLTISSTGVATFSNYIDTPEVRQGGEFMIGRSSNIIRMGSGDASDSLAFYSGSSQRMRITSGGNVLFNGTSSIPSTSVFGSGFWNITGQRQILRQSTDIISTTGSSLQQFFTPSGQAGSIDVNGTSTSYITSSDYRLKENVNPITNAIARLNQLKPSRFNFITNADRTVDGFLAHEVQEIIPEAISGEKDAMKDEEFVLTPRVDEVTDEKGNVITEAVEAVMETRTVPDYQGIDQSKIVPLLTAAIQEQQTIIEDLKSRIETLEG